VAAPVRPADGEDHPPGLRAALVPAHDDLRAGFDGEVDVGVWPDQQQRAAPTVGQGFGERRPRTHTGSVGGQHHEVTRRQGIVECGGRIVDGAEEDIGARHPP
jgi:hypothetical protein